MSEYPLFGAVLYFNELEVAAWQLERSIFARQDGFRGRQHHMPIGAFLSSFEWTRARRRKAAIDGGAVDRGVATGRREGGLQPLIVYVALGRGGGELLGEEARAVVSSRGDSQQPVAGLTRRGAARRTPADSAPPATCLLTVK